MKTTVDLPLLDSQNFPNIMHHIFGQTPHRPILLSSSQPQQAVWFYGMHPKSSLASWVIRTPTFGTTMPKKSKSNSTYMEARSFPLLAAVS